MILGVIIFGILILVACIWGLVHLSKRRIEDDFKVASGEKIASKQTKTYNYGFSYIVIFKIINILLSLVLGVVVFYLSTGPLYSVFFDIDSGTGIFGAVTGIVIALLSYWLLNLPIKLFENIAIIARNSTEILNKMNEDSSRIG